MWFSSIFLTLSLGILATTSWFGMLQELYCLHRADRFYFAGLTQQLHLKEARSQSSTCVDTWKFDFDHLSIHHRRQLELRLSDWQVPHE